MRHAPHFGRADVVLPVWRLQPGVHLLLRKRRLAPTEVAHHVGSMGEGLPGPQPHHASGRGRVPGAPVHGAGLLLHDPERLHGHAAIKVVVKGREVRVPTALPAAFVGVVEPEILQPTQRVAVPAHQVKVCRQRAVVELSEEQHCVVRDQPARRQLAQDVALRAVEAQHLVGGKAPVVQALCGVGFSDAGNGRVDLLEAGVNLAPEHGAPGGVERVDSAVAGLQPRPETLLGLRRITQHRVVAAVFVVGLPGDHGRVLAIARRHFAGDAAGLRQVGVA